MRGTGFCPARRIGDVHAKAVKPFGHLDPDPAKAEDAGTPPPDASLEGKSALEPGPVTGKPVCRNDAARLCKHHAYGKVGAIFCQDIWCIGNADATLLAGGKINRVKADAKNRDYLKVRTGFDKIGRCPQITACGDGLYQGPDFRKESGLVGRLEQAMHGEVLCERARFPFGQGTDLKKMGL
jgi:hypothetical protein